METLRVKIQTKGGEVKREPDAAVKAMKAYDEYEESNLRVLGIPFGGPIKGRDADGEAFHEDTNIWIKEGDSIPLTYYHGFGPDDPDEVQPNPVVIGRAKYTGADERGHWFEPRFDTEEPLAQRVLADAAKAKASSGAVGHLVRMGKGGLIDVWPVGELAVFDTNEWRLPANELAVIEAKAEVPEAAVQAEQAKPDAANEAEAKNNTVIEPLEVAMDEKEKDEVVEETPSELSEIKSMMAEILKAQKGIEKGSPTVTVVKSRGDKSPKEMFIDYCKTGRKAAMQEGTAEEGGYIVPDDFLPMIVEKRDEMSIMRAAGATVIQTSRDVLQVPYENTSHANFSITSEEGAVSQGEPTLGSAAITIYKFTKLVKVSEELLMDQAANLESFLASAFGRAWGLTENAYTIAGTGSSQPQGILYGGTAGKTFADTNSITAAEIVELQHVLPSPYAPGAAWVMRNATLGHLRGLTGNPFYFQPAPAGNGQQMLGSPVFLSDSMGVYSTTANKSVAYGNMSYLYIAENMGMNVRRLNELYAGTGQVGFLATVRFGSAVIQAEAIQYATQA